ncbi:hypothetical protein BU17DRAFT_45623, partial [Hysterangium stoloniferum]
DVEFVINMPHDCAQGLCSNTGTSLKLQKHQETSRQLLTIQHKDDEHFIINLHTLHNAHILYHVFKSAPQSNALLSSGLIWVNPWGSGTSRTWFQLICCTLT